MSKAAAKLLPQILSNAGIKEIEHWCNKYPESNKQSAVLAVLRIAQEEHGYLTPEIMDAAAEYLGMQSIAVYEVATFYSMYELSPVGKHIINVCTNISCKLAGSDTIAQSLRQRLGIEFNETTVDGRFTLRAVECLGACVNAPVMCIDKNYHENLNDALIDNILELY